MERNTTWTAVGSMAAVVAAVAAVCAFLFGQNGVVGKDAAATPPTVRDTQLAPTTVATTAIATTVVAPTLPPVTTSATTVVLSPTTLPLAPAASPIPADGSRQARADLIRYGELLHSGDVDAAWQYLHRDFQIDSGGFDSFKRFWTQLVEPDFTFAVDKCDVTGESGSCNARMVFTYSEVSKPEYAGKCFAESVRLEVQWSIDRFQMTRQTSTGSLKC
jgi:hypothetical protein